MGGLYKYLDIKLEGMTATRAAPVILGLHTASDQLRMAFPASRFTVLPLTISGGFFNSLSAGKLGGIMAMMNGQYQGLMNSAAQVLANGPNEVHAAAVTKFLRVIAAFCFGLLMGSRIGKDGHISTLTPMAKRRFTVVGMLYALTLALAETPRGVVFGK